MGGLGAGFCWVWRDRGFAGCGGLKGWWLWALCWTSAAQAVGKEGALSGQVALGRRILRTWYRRTLTHPMYKLPGFGHFVEMAQAPPENFHAWRRIAPAIQPAATGRPVSLPSDVFAAAIPLHLTSSVFVQRLFFKTWGASSGHSGSLPSPAAPHSPWRPHPASERTIDQTASPRVKTGA